MTPKKKAVQFLFPFLLLTVLVAPAQDQKNAGVMFTSRTEFVLVPIVASDKAGKHITGLTKDDFELQEDGKSKSIASLEEVKTFTSRAIRSAPKRDVYSNELAGDSSPKRLTIFALDLVNTPFLDQTYAREQLIKYLAHEANPEEPIALVAIRLSGIEVLHDFSSDPAVLVAALKRASGDVAANELVVTGSTATSSRPFNPSEINGESRALQQFISGDSPTGQVQIALQANAIDATLEAFQHVAEAFAGIPGRKSLIWATAAFPFGLDAATGGILAPTVYREGTLMNTPLFGDRRSRTGALPSFPSIDDVRSNGQLTRLEPVYQRTLQMLNDANIAVYPVDARGLMVFFPGADVSRIEGWNSLNRALFEGSRDTMVNFAAMTGGKAFYDRNDLDVAFAKAADDSSSYYMLGYYLDKNAKPGWHKLQVKAKRGGIEVRARSGFFVIPPERQHDTSRMDIRMALVSPLDYTAVPLSVRWDVLTAAGAKRKAHFELNIPPNSNVVDSANNGVLDLEVVAQARDATGQPADQCAQHVQAKLGAEALQQWQRDGLNYTNDIIVPPGQYSVRFVVRDNLTGRLGSVTAPLLATR